MRRIVVATFTSLDGVMQAPGGPQEDPTGGFTLGGWTAPISTKRSALPSARSSAGPSICCSAARPTTSSRRTGPTSPIRRPDRSGLQPGDQVRRLALQPQAGLAEQPVAGPRHRRLAQELKGEDGPDLLVQGSSDLLQTLWKEGLVDELSVLIFPVVLGKGKRLFGNGAAPAGLKLVKSRSFPTGVIVANYRPDGAVKTGDFQLAEPTEAELARRRNLT